MSRKTTSVTIHICPACPTTRRTQKDIVEHAKINHGMSRNQATGGWTRPADWDPCDKANVNRRVK